MVGGLVDWRIGGLVGWWTGGLVDGCGWVWMGVDGVDGVDDGRMDGGWTDSCYNSG